MSINALLSVQRFQVHEVAQFRRDGASELIKVEQTATRERQLSNEVLE